ncbi:hypothetical protein MUK42_02734 [Musa troglodytarum]|uniref:DNA/RNA-binding protein Alba-like domain-containing protein n=1 Tax=Musa troglodytarum TaxID=320322 RepID=A0A9E7EK15_9LILI|nr:hypothetical protein MUK42_02734 [Musa troglodytarum]
MASSALSPSPQFSSLHHRQQRPLRTSGNPSSLPGALFPLFSFPDADPRRRRTSLLILSSSSNARPAYARELERKQEILESHGLDPSDFISRSADKLRRRRRDEENRAGKGKRMPLPLDEPKPPLRTTHRLLQVLGGKARRKKLLSPKGMDVRPMMEVVRGAAFDILQVHFVEMDPWVVSEVLQPNLEWTGFSDVSVIHTIRVERFLEQAEQSSDKNRSFEYISVTPPYTAVDYTMLMDQLGKSPLVGEDCFILVEYPLKTLLADSCGHLIKIADRRFGRTNLKVERPRPESVINENEIRITSQGVVRNYVSYATSLLQEKRGREIVLKAMGQAISKAVAIAEIIKKRFSGLYQDTTISSVSITDVWEPIEEGLVPLEMTRHVSMISISLSTRELNKNSPGYQAPLQVEQPKRQQRYQQFQQSQQQQQFRPKQTQGQHNEEVEEEEEGVGEEATVDLLDMRIIREAMATIRGDMAITKVDMAIIKPDMVDMAMIKKMVDGTLTGVEVVDVVEAIGIIVVADMEGEEEVVVEGLVAEVTAVDEEGWVAVAEGYNSSAGCGVLPCLGILSKNLIGASTMTCGYAR